MESQDGLQLGCRRRAGIPDQRGTGLFSGRLIYINISNMVNTNGVLQGQIREDNTTDFAFSPDVNAYIPESPRKGRDQ
ncbi:hypothetical protein [Negadavirga shengliensis]|uniref:Uncharacterized protein n=1 Tax=Negadavirga shengliensis TaxID=1389218 RepID=A0ABV9T3G3_9BACT